jgi:transcriptional regulator with XRE-family HTH domain
LGIDLLMLSGKLINLRSQHGLTVDDVAVRTGISLKRLSNFEAAETEPTGDEILILADLFSCDFRYFISNIKSTNLEKSDKLFRMLGEELSKDDRLSISQFFYLCESEEWLYKVLEIKKRKLPTLPDRITTNKIFKQQGKLAAEFYRNILQLKEIAIVPDVYSLIRSFGVHVFRRKLQN